MGCFTTTTSKIEKDTRTDKQKQRDIERVVNRSVYKIQTEINNLNRDESEALKEVERLAKKGQHEPAKIKAKNVAMLRA